MTRREENILRSLPDSDRQHLNSFIPDSSARSAVVVVGMDCATIYIEPQGDERERVLREMKLSTM